MLKKYWVLWTYSANYSSLIKLEAETPELAVELCTCYFSKDFHAKASVYVFDTAPVFSKLCGTKVD